jgi:hypothetical protein
VVGEQALDGWRVTPQQVGVGARRADPLADGTDLALVGTECHDDPPGADLVQRRESPLGRGTAVVPGSDRHDDGRPVERCGRYRVTEVVERRHPLLDVLHLPRLTTGAT